MSKTAFITGITGQDGSYLAEYLLNEDYEVWGLVRRQSSPNIMRIEDIKNELFLLEGDLTDQSSLIAALKKSEPDEIYNLGAQSFVGTSWHQPVYTGDVTGLSVTRLLEAIKMIVPDAKFIQASSSEMFGKVKETPQTESTPFYPRSPYGVAKVYAYWICVNYRESYDMNISNSICFNHESPRRGIEFVTRKISDGVARIKLGLSDTIRLGNLDAERDWGHAKDYVRAMHMILQQDEPDDYVVSTGITHSVKDFLIEAFRQVDIEDWEDHVVQDPKFMRPAEVDYLRGDSSYLKEKTGWEPEYKFKDLVEDMVEHDLHRLRDN